MLLHWQGSSWRSFVKSLEHIVGSHFLGLCWSCHVCNCCTVVLYVLCPVLCPQVPANLHVGRLVWKMLLSWLLTSTKSQPTLKPATYFHTALLTGRLHCSFVTGRALGDVSWSCFADWWLILYFLQNVRWCKAPPGLYGQPAFVSVSG